METGKAQSKRAHWGEIGRRMKIRGKMSRVETWPPERNVEGLGQESLKQGAGLLVVYYILAQDQWGQ